MANRRRDTPPRKPAPIGSDAALWANLSSEFQSLKEEERPRARMFAEGHYVTGSPYCGAWWLRDSLSENFQVRFERLARQAGSALGPPEGVPPLTFWLHELHHNLRKHRSHLLRTVSASGIIRGVRWKGGGVYIHRVCEASETFCLRLEQQTLDEERAIETAPKLGLPVTSHAQSNDKAANKQQKPLTDREQKIWEVIQRGHKATPPLRGTTYCREVDAAKVSPPRKGIWRDAPRTYVAAYKSGDKRLVHWIQDEKSKIRRKAELAGLAKTRAKLASE